ncbi:Pectic acid lyase [Novipirellula galeiformis]|uniref:Pectic acid lyase n=2 Tax=Novipirellula galeiformis TaxID=2528004 RepID=A0A5C6CP49_9BACT|nr:Pectic acid lyase [Novipirellula galeiformis]
MHSGGDTLGWWVSRVARGRSLGQNGGKEGALSGGVDSRRTGGASLIPKIGTVHRQASLMKLVHYLKPVRTVLFLWCALTVAAGHAEEPLGRENAVKALHRCVEFFRTHASTHGGYVFRISEDLSLREGEVKVGNTTAWIEPPATPSVGNAYLEAYRLTSDPLLLDAAMETATALLRGQLVSGGWGEQIEFASDDRERYAYRSDSVDGTKRRNTTTFDDDKTQSVIRFLMRLDIATGQSDAAIHDAVLYALDGVLQSQYPNGAWPQRYDSIPTGAPNPVLKASYPTTWSKTYVKQPYDRYYTLNDGTIADLITTLLEAFDLYHDARYFNAAIRGGDFLLLAQMPLPQPGWAQQYNPQMQPSWARKFEPPAITGGESQQVMRTLLLLYRRSADERYREAVKTALTYYETCLRKDGRLARFYELKTNRPLYMTQTYELSYSDADVPTHYSFVVKSSLGRIRSELEKIESTPRDRLWVPSQPKPPKQTESLAAEAARVVAELDARGAWVESGKLKSHPEANVKRIISSATFIRNLNTLATYIAATN